MGKAKVVWSSALDKDMVADLDEKEIAELVQELDDAVMRVCQDFGI